MQEFLLFRLVLVVVKQWTQIQQPPGLGGAAAKMPTCSFAVRLMFVG